MSNKNKNKQGIVYSTDPDFEYVEQYYEQETLPNNQQKLRVELDKKQRNGKKVTLITRFVGSQEDLITLSKVLKNKCGVGGTVKDGYILIQGDFRDKVTDILIGAGYKVSHNRG